MARKKVHTPKQVTTFLEELKNQTDRGVGVIAATVIEEILELLIQERLLELSAERHDALFGRMRPLSTLSAKTELAFALGLISNT